MKHVDTAVQDMDGRITEHACRKKLREVGIKVSRPKFCAEVKKHHVPFTENTLQCRGGAPNRYYDWPTIKAFFEGFIRQVN